MKTNKNTSTTAHKKGAPHNSQLMQLKRIEGQVRGVSKMIEDNRYCIDILQQLKAIKSSIATVEKKIISEHLDHCVHQAISSKSKKEASSVIEEIKELIYSVKT